MSGYLLDANILSDFVRHRHGRVARHLAALRDRGEKDIAISIIAAGQLRFGIEKRSSQRLTRRVEQVLAAIDVLPLTAPADAIYGRLRADLERRGQPMGASDLWIAAHALATGHILVTDDRGFDRIAELECENWLAA